MSEFLVQVVQIGPVRKHPGADRLEITDIHGGYPCIIKIGDFKEKDLAVYIPVDAIVPDRAEFKFLAPKDWEPGAPLPERYRRIKAKRLRGVFSMGLVVPMSVLPPGNYQVGDDVREILQIKKWEPEEDPAGAVDQVKEWAKAQAALSWWRKAFTVVFWLRVWWRVAGGRRKVRGVPPPGGQEYTDLEGYRKHKTWFRPGESVVVSEKIHGGNARYAWVKGRFHVGSHHQWKGYPGLGMRLDWWWRAARNCDLKKKMKRYPDLQFCGEVYGPGVQKGFDYGVKQIEFRCFDILNLKTGSYLPWDEFKKVCNEARIPMVPVHYEGPWKYELEELAEGQAFSGNHVREGIVIKSVVEDMSGSRKILKLPGQGYLLKRSE